MQYTSGTGLKSVQSNIAELIKKVTELEATLEQKIKEANDLISELEKKIDIIENS